MACGLGAKTLLFLLAAVVVPALSAPTIKGSVPAKDIQGENQVLTEDEQEQVVARLILQLAREFDEGRLSLVDLMGRSAEEDDEHEAEVKPLSVPVPVSQDVAKSVDEKESFEKSPARAT